MINEERRKIQGEALSALETSNFNGIFLLPTGTGKSWVLIESLKKLIKLHDYQTIWYLCNSTDLRDTDFKNELIKWGAEDLIDKVEFMCYQTAYKIEGAKVDVLICDEFDYSLTPKYSRVYHNNEFKHKILTTAFIDSSKEKLQKEIAEIIYSIDLGNVEEKGVLNKSKYFIVNYMMTEPETTQYKYYNRKMTDLIHSMNNGGNKKLLNYKLELVIRERKRFLNALESSAFYCRKLMSEIYAADKKCKILTFCELNRQADAVCKYTYHMGSDLDNLEKFRKDEIQALAVCGKVNRGVNIPGIKHIIFESSNQSKTQMIQRLGRGKRLTQSELLNVYFLVPHYYDNGKIKPTKVKDWIVNASNGLDLSNANLYRFKS